MAAPGILYIIATPIGNLSDITLRALDTIKQVQVLLAEDTRITKKLLDHYGIHVRLESLHDFNESAKVETLIRELLGGADIGLVCDAGTPLICDPGFRLALAANKKGIAVRPVPGPCALVTALTVSGLPTDRFVFEGFLPKKVAERGEFLKSLRHESRTMVFYEAPQRLRRSILDCIRVFGGSRNAAVLRELTKLHEQHLTGSLEQIECVLGDAAQVVKGECVLVIAGDVSSADEERLEKAAHLLADLQGRISHRDAVEVVARHTGLGRNRLYALGLDARLKKQS
ncbi:MAG: 16S rRNA (cytidine(1402)-2'-O)-methyltransferase [Gammaproteobacteria bacterium]|nr:16S rRNA (cytidine(1402)-2'-O)-methyltransferase [Gammaproteobacteria bacterium]